MATNAYDIGDPVRLFLTLTNLAGMPHDPAALTLTLKMPDGAVDTYTLASGVVKDSIGNYHADVPAAQAGYHEYRWEAADAGGASLGAEQGRFWVRAKNVG